MVIGDKKYPKNFLMPVIKPAKLEIFYLLSDQMLPSNIINFTLKIPATVTESVMRPSHTIL